MPQTINIVTTAGQRIDTFAEVSVEMNMGGLSILDLSQRSATYTNQFDIPITPNNESIFAFADSPMRNNRPLLDVYVSVGFWQSKAVLKVESFDKSYKCSLTYADALTAIQSGTYERMYDGKVLLSGSTDINLVRGLTQSGLTTDNFTYLNTSGSAIPVSTYKTGSIFVPLKSLLTKIETEYSITISGDILTDTEFEKAYISLTNLFVVRTGTPGSYTYTTSTVDSGNLVTDLIKEIALIFLCNVTFDENEIIINKAVFTATGVNIENIEVSKTLYSGMAKDNYISYSLCKSISDIRYASDNITGDGVGVKEVVKLKTYLPASDTVWNPGAGLYGKFVIASDAEAVNKIIIGIMTVYPADSSILYNGTFYDFTYGVDDDTFVALGLSLSGYYSTTLNPILSNPVILDAEAWISPAIIQSILSGRVIYSQKLSGRYWVDSMAYNLTSGMAKLKLIRL